MIPCVARNDVGWCSVRRRKLNTGIGVEVIHYLDDNLWRAGDL
jgi:predicted ribosome-associated RNA-binding protein Tma20